jgi:hypothetical protein
MDGERCVKKAPGDCRQPPGDRRLNDWKDFVKQVVRFPGGAAVEVWNVEQRAGEVLRPLAGMDHRVRAQ